MAVPFGTQHVRGWNANAPGNIEDFETAIAVVTVRASWAVLVLVQWLVNLHCAHSGSAQRSLSHTQR